MKQDRWPGAVVAVLADCKRCGLAFDDAWLQATRRFPFPVAPKSEATLFDENENGEPHDPPLVKFFKRVSRDAYDDVIGNPGSGRGPALRHFRPAMLRGEMDDSSPAVRRRAA